MASSICSRWEERSFWRSSRSAPSAEAILAIWPPAAEGIWVLPTVTLAALLALNWWASWYPGAEPGGGGYVVQNMLACRDERQARSAALFFNIAHYALRS